ncbi:MAG: M56 family metallopeptidase [Dyadobacter sp.]|uniref:M56 family metallopeptidase n=1 Tax=Dyadobacter sp. TaxID=1914288 RepID=UPI00326652E0
MEQLPYWVKVNLYWFLFYACYWLLFRKHTFFRWNRVYLVATLCLAIALPSIEFSEPVKMLPVAVADMIVNPEMTMTPEIIEPESNWADVIPMIYLAGVVMMSFKFLEGLYKLRKLIGKSECIDLERFTLVLLPESLGFATGSFSFFSYLIVSRNDYENHFQTILEHEEVHIRQWHSIDIILIEILKIVCWFNPVLWLYKLALREVHEYLADEQAANRDSYATFLVLYAKNAAIRSISNQFYNSSLLKGRISMIYKGRTSQWFRGKYLLLIPFVTVLVIITAARKQIISSEKQEVTALTNIPKAIDEKEKVITNRPLTLSDTTIRTKKRSTGKATRKAASQKSAVSQEVTESKETEQASGKSPVKKNEELRQFSNWSNNLVPKNPFAETGEAKNFRNYAYNHVAMNYSDILAPKLTVIEPPKMKFHRYGFTIGRPVLRAVDMKFNVK